MKISLKKSFIIVAASLLLDGCCTTRHLTRWEYKVVSELDARQRSEKTEDLMNDLGKDGWIFVSHSGQFLYFKRPLN